MLPMVKRGLMLLVVFVVLAAAGFWFALPKYRHWKEQNSVRQSREFFAAGDIRNATLAARRALAINGANTEACRVMAAVSESLRSPVALQWRQRVVELQPGDFTNRLDFVRTAILFGQYEPAARMMSGVSETNRDTATFHQMAAMVAIGLNDLALAERHLGRASELEPTNKLFELNRAILHLQAKDAPVVAGALKTLQQLYRDPECHQDALRHLALAAARHGELAKAVALTGELSSDPKASLDDRLMHLAALQVAADPAFTNFLGEVEARCAAGTETVNTFANWLLSHRLAEESERWLVSLPAELQSNAPVLLARADTFIARADWAGLRGFTKNATWPGAEFVRRAMLARGLRELGETLAAQNEWRAAARAAAEDHRQLAILTRLANKWHWPREREELLWSIIQRFPSERWALESLHETYLAAGDTRGLQRLYAKLVDFNRDDLIAKNNLAAVSLLLNSQTNQAHQFAREVYQRATTNAVFASTYAYSLYLQGRGAEGVAVLSALKPAQLEIPGVALYYGALQSATAPDRARRYLDLAGRGKLLPEETNLLANARRGL